MNPNAKAFMFSSLGTAIIVLLMVLASSVYFTTIVAPNGISYEVHIDGENQVVHPGDTILPVVTRCVKGSTGDVRIDTTIIQETDNPTQDIRHLGSFETTLEVGCKTLTGNPREIPIDMLPGRYFIRSEMTYLRTWFIFRRQKTITSDTESFVVAGEINGNGASDVQLP